MCGIFWYSGLLSLPKDDRNAIIERCATALAHRGPDASRHVVANNDHCFGCHRLAIINPNAQDAIQPLETDTHIIVCNGQIYNYASLCTSRPRTDVDVILQMFAKPKASPGQIFDALDGDFACVVYEKATGRVIAARDPVGVRPMFYACDETSKVIAMASEAKALVGLPNVKDVRVFPPGCVWDSVNCRFAEYAAQVPDTNRIVDLLKEAVRKRIAHSHRQVALLCSGGLDSSLVLALAISLRGGDPSSVHTFSIKYRDGLSMDDTYARMLTSAMGVRHTTVEFDLEDVLAALPDVVRTCETCDPNTIRAAVPMYLLSKHISTHTDFKVLLSGEGSDELFAGYSYFGRAPSGPALAAECDRLVRNLHMFDVLRADRCISRWGLEVRVPFLDKDLVRYVSSLSGASRAFDARGVEKALLRAAFAGRPECETLETMRVLERQKERFSDGCGNSYVPDLLRALAPPDANDLGQRTAAERAKYEELFVDAFGDLSLAKTWVVKRELPAWTERAGGERVLAY
jgi:asparagine synthase (glutamine-hydrolysing)